LGVGILYMVGTSHYLLPDHQDDSLTEDYAIREYLSEIVVMPQSGLIGQKIFESDLAEMEFRILAVVRGQRQFRPNVRSKIEENDLLLVQGQLDELLKIKETAGVEIHSDVKWEDGIWQSDHDEAADKSEELRIAEVLIIPKSDLI